MARVKILLEPGESALDADHALHKALEHHASGDAHVEHGFGDPAMVDLSQRADQAHAKMYNEMIREITELLDEEYSDGGI